MKLSIDHIWSIDDLPSPSPDNVCLYLWSKLAQACEQN